MNQYECAECGDTYEAEKPDAQEGANTYCTCCWEQIQEEDGFILYEGPEEDWEPDLIGSEWYHEDLP